MSFSLPVKCRALLFLFLPAVAFSQENKVKIIDSLLFQDTARVGYLSRKDHKQSFRKGDTIVFSFQEKALKGISRIKITAPSKFTDTLLAGPVKIKDLVLLPKENGEYTFSFYHRALLQPGAKTYSMAISRRHTFIVPPPPPKPDTVAAVAKVIPKPDSLWLPLLDTSIYLQPRGNLYSSPRSVLALVIPQGVTNLYGWVGAGTEGATFYSQMAEGLPPDWQQAGVKSPLDAYARGKLRQAPAIKASSAVTYYLAGPAGQETFLRNGTVPGAKASGKSRNIDFFQAAVKGPSSAQTLFLCLENPDPISGVEVNVKLLGLLVLEKSK